MSVEQLLLRLHDPKPTGRDRWRCACPACGSTNRSTLSVGIGDTGAVLLKCWKSGCSPEQIARAVGLQLEDLFPRIGTSAGGSAPLKRRAMLSARQAIDLIEFECLLVWTAASNLANGYVLTPPDRERLATAGRRIQAVIDEVRA